MDFMVSCYLQNVKDIIDILSYDPYCNKYKEYLNNSLTKP